MGPAGEAPHRTRNMLLSELPAADLDKLWPHLARVSLRQKTRIIEPGKAVEYVTFVETGIVSMIASLEDGSRVEVGMVGFEGMVGSSLLLGVKTSSLEGMVQVPGTALRLSASQFSTALVELPSFMPTLLRYVDAFNFAISIAAACNARHPLEQRLARWLLVTRDRIGENAFPMTHEFMAIMLGVRRPGVTLAIGALQHSGLVTHSRGFITIKDAPRLEQASCECYQAVRNRFIRNVDH